MTLKGKENKPSRWPRPVGYFLSAAAIRTLAFFTVVVALWLNLSARSPNAASHTLYVASIVLLIDGTMTYFLYKRKRFAWIYQIVTAILICVFLVEDYQSPSRHLNQVLMMLIYAGPAALICGLFPVSVRWFWQKKPSREDIVIQNMFLANGATMSNAPASGSEGERIQKTPKPSWSTKQSIGLICLIVLSIATTWLIMHSVDGGKARYENRVADIHTDPKHFWFFIACDFGRCLPVYVWTILLWKKWRASKRTE